MSDAWETVQRSHAIANSVYLCAVNRVGREGTVEHFGQSFVTAPDGRVLHRASPSEEEIEAQTWLPPHDVTDRLKWLEGRGKVRREGDGWVLAEE